VPDNARCLSATPTEASVTAATVTKSFCASICAASPPDDKPDAF